MASKSEYAKYSLFYISSALEDSYSAAAFVTNPSPSVVHLALIIGTQFDYLVIAGYVLLHLLLDMLLSIFYIIDNYEIQLYKIRTNNQSSLLVNFYSPQSYIFGLSFPN